MCDRVAGSVRAWVPCLLLLPTTNKQTFTVNINYLVVNLHLKDGFFVLRFFFN